jgi:hypothetical protein
MMEFQDSFTLRGLWQSAGCLLERRDWKENESILKCKAKLEFRFIAPVQGSVAGEGDGRNAHAIEHDVASGCRYGLSVNMFLKLAQPHHQT